MTKEKTFFIYLIVCLMMILLSLIGLFFHNYEILLSVSVGTVFGIVYFFLLFKGMNFIRKDMENKNIILFYVFTFLRMLVAFLGIFLPALILYLTRKDDSPYRYLNVIAATLPFLIIPILMMRQKKETTGDLKNE